MSANRIGVIKRQLGESVVAGIVDRIEDKHWVVGPRCLRKRIEGKSYVDNMSDDQASPASFRRI